MAFMAISSWSWQSQRSDPSTSPVKHCEWMRSNGMPSVGSPMTIASAVSSRRVPFDTSRSKPMASNIPHLVGMRADAMRHSGPVCVGLTGIDSFLIAMASEFSRDRRAPLCGTLLRLGSGAAHLQGDDLLRAEAQLLKD